MQTKPFGTSGMHITPVGFGTWALGGGEWVGGWGPQDDAASVATIHRALKGRTVKPYVFTKCSTVWNEKREVSQSLKAQSLRKELENSLRRLQTDVIDLYQIHWPYPEADIEEGWSTLACFRQEGKVRYIGVSNFNVEQMQRAQRIAPISSLQPPYSLIKRDVEQEILPFCQQHHIGVIVYSPMQSGLLTGAMTPERVKNLPDDDWRKRDPEFREPRLSRNLKLVDLLRQIGKQHGRSPGEVAIAWTLHHPAVTGAIVGGRRPEQVERNVGAANSFHLYQHDIDSIEAFVQANR